MSKLTNHSNKDEKINPKDFENLIDQYQFNVKELTPGKMLTGKVVKKTSEYVLVDVGYKSEGLIPLDDFRNNQATNINLGDEVEAILERKDSKEGYLILSKKKATALKALNNLEKAFHQKSWIIGEITQKTKSGYTVNVGINTFLPESHADVKTVKNPEKLIGNRYKFKVIKFDRKTENAVLSRKLYLLDEKEKRKQEVFSKLTPDKKVKGKVKSLTKFGAFVDLGGVEGLLHISDMSWGKIGHPSELFRVGEEIEVIVLDFNQKEEKISLGYKQLTPDPWENIEEKYQVGQYVEGKVVSLADFGAFIELEKGVEGLAHISDLSWSRKIVHPKKILSPGQKVTVCILGINPSARRISLGLKQATPHPLELLQKKYSAGSRVKGKVTNITDFGAFLEVEKEIEGLIHISDISWKKINHPSEVLTVGQETEAVILNIDVENEKLSLGIKQLQGDIWSDFFKRHQVGDLVDVKIVRLTNFGVFVEITPGIEGVVFLSELDEKKIENPEEVFSVGEEKTAKIIKINKKERKISLSFKRAQQELQKLEYQKYLKNQDGRLKLGDIMKEELKKIDPPKKENNTKGRKKGGKR